MNKLKFKKIISIGLVAAAIFTAVPQRAFAANADTASANSNTDTKSCKASAGISAADAYDSAIQAKKIAEAYTDYASSDIVSNFNKAFQQLDQAYQYAVVAYTSEKYSTADIAAQDANNAANVATSNSIAAFNAVNVDDGTSNKNVRQSANYVFCEATNAASEAAYAAAYAAYTAKYDISPFKDAATYAVGSAYHAACYAISTAISTNNTKANAAAADTAISDYIAKNNISGNITSGSDKQQKQQPVSGDFKLDSSKLQVQPISGDFKLDSSKLQIQPVSGDSKLDSSKLQIQPVSGNFKLDLDKLQIQPVSDNLKLTTTPIHYNK